MGLEVVGHDRPKTKALPGRQLIFKVQFASKMFKEVSYISASGHGPCASAHPICPTVCNSCTEDRYRLQGPPHGTIGLNRSERTFERAGYCLRPLRGYQHQWLALPQQA